MREHRLREQHDLVGPHPGPPRRARVAPPGDAGAQPVRGLERVQAAALGELPAPQHPVDPPPVLAPVTGRDVAAAFHEVREFGECGFHSHLDSVPEFPVQRPGEFRHVLSYLSNYLGRCGALFFSQLGGKITRQSGPWPGHGCEYERLLLTSQ
ncbi:hypothetical protein A8W25_14270 [Streptomyces sp. ERV7]|nr:hypothetical protein A8W25_14270 [Streptomyces sp. ERV7]